MSVEPDHRHITLGEFVRVTDGGERNATVSTNGDRPSVDLGEHSQGALVHEPQRSGAVNTGTKLVSGLEGHVDREGGCRGQVTTNRLGAVHQPHGAGGP